MKLTINNVFFLTLFILFSCGKKNEVGAPPTPITGIGFQNTNLLGSFDPSFEAQTNISNRSNRPIRSGRPIGAAQANRHFRVTGGARRGNVDHEITQVAAKSGSKSLRLYLATSQTLIMPISTRQKESPLKVTSGARYRYQAFVRLPRNIRNRPSGTLEIAFKDGFNPSGKTRVTLNVDNGNSNGWYSLVGEFEVPSLATNAKLYLQINGSNDLLVDDLTLIRIR